MKSNDLILQKLSKSYHGQVVFSDLSLALSPGNAYCLMAPSGTGKTTLFRILMGLETPDSGTIDGLKNLKISAVFQEDRLLEGYDVLTNLRFVCRQRLSDAELSAYAAALLPPIIFAARPARSLRPFDFRRTLQRSGQRKPQKSSCTRP